MNEQDIKVDLHHISNDVESEVAGLVDDIQQQLQRDPLIKTRRIANMYNLSRFALLGILLFVTVSAFAFSQIINIDPGFEGERAIEMVTVIDASITQGNYTVTLEWGYMDANRAIIAYTFTDATGNPIPLEQFEPIHHFVFNPDTSGANSGRENVPWGNPIEIGNIIIVEGQLDRFPTESANLDNDGDGFVTIQYTVQSNLADPHTFRIELPFNTPFELVGNERLDPNIDLRLTDLVITPSMIAFEFCFRIPENIQPFAAQQYSQWRFEDYQMRLDGVDITESIDREQALNVSLWQLGNISNRYCNDVGLPVAIDTLPERMSITVTGLEKWTTSSFSLHSYFTQDEADMIVDAYAAQGIVVETDAIAYDRIYLVFPDEWNNYSAEERSRIREAADSYIEDLGNAIISGPWTIELEIEQTTNSATVATSATSN